MFWKRLYDDDGDDATNSAISVLVNYTNTISVHLSEINWTTGLTEVPKHLYYFTQTPLICYLKEVHA